MRANTSIISPSQTPCPASPRLSSVHRVNMSFSSLVHDLPLRGSAADARRPRGDASITSAASTLNDAASRTSHISRAMSYASTAATSVSIAGDISSQLHGGYAHPLARQWQAERQLTKVSQLFHPKSPGPPS